VATAEEALAVAQEWRPDFVFVDVVSPRLGGVAVGRELGGHYPSMRLIGTSGHRLDELTLLDATEAGFDHCIGKPFTIEVLDAVLRGNAVPMWELV
jgi:DNA-binding response OmpR family regulator